MHTAVKYSRNTLCSIFLVVLISAPARAQNLDMAVHVGSMGLGADLIATVQSNLGLRVSLNYIPFDINSDADSIDFSLDLPTPQVLLVADFYAAGRFRLSGGVMISSGDFEARGELTEPVEIGNTIGLGGDGR